MKLSPSTGTPVGRIRAMGAMYPKNWDPPKVDRDFAESVKILKRIERRFNQ